ncbi:amidohydrolase [Rhodovarius crocodyli]|uniref:Amidohydrolase n=1 Tax=Rhodovarius crocodyli TaxID=1979269 RepID=A0A437LXE8_9PROT|nr:amidohydrolase family protein [Rhodovarius crocodyli]RVT90088.1 amidohydrolase [Rhodovarius crocodyli]
MADLLLRAAWLWAGADTPPQPDARVLLRDGVVAALGMEATGVPVLDMGDAVLVPGFTCAHQHGRGLSQLQLGYPDDRLEAWANRRRLRGGPAAHPLVLLAAARMLANGITGCLHANWSYGGPQEEELAEVSRAYAESGMRAAICVGVADRGALVLPEEATDGFIAGLPPALRPLAQSVRRHPFIATAAEAARVHDGLSARWAGTRLRFMFGPAGPHWVSDRLFAELAAAARDRATGLHFHLLESPAQQQACRAIYPEGVMRRLLALGALGPRNSAAHGVYLTPDDMAVMAGTGTALVLNPGSNLRLHNGPPPVSALARSGVRLALGGDDCELNDDRDPWGELRLVATLGHLPPAELLRAATETAAAVAGLPGGRIAPGLPADIVALAPPAAHDPDLPLEHALTGRATGRDVRMTMVGGEVLYRDGRLPRHDLPTLEQAALEAARAVRRHPARAPADVEALGRALLDFYASTGAAPGR